MKEFGDMTVREIVVLLPSIFAEYEQKIAAYTNKSYIETVWGCGYKWIR